jgi:predicted DNA-binding antitoxin AbrB/MazE fold protein
MTKTIEAIFEKGVFRPTQILHIVEGTRVEVLVPSKDLQSDAQHQAHVLDEIAALPMEGPDDGFSGADHDKVLYKDPHD